MEDSVVIDEPMDDTANADDLDELKKGAAKKKGRGFDSAGQKSSIREFESLPGEEGAAGAPQRSVEGWIIFVTNVHEEAQEEEVRDLFKEYGNVMNMHLNLDRRTGYFKGYAIVQYEKKEEAAEAIKNLNGTEFLNQELAADWCFVKGKGKKHH